MDKETQDVIQRAIEMLACSVEFPMECCRGESEIASRNRMKFLKLRRAIHELRDLDLNFEELK